jgi:hypothetical protein
VKGCGAVRVTVDSTEDIQSAAFGESVKVAIRDLLQILQMRIYHFRS